MGGATPLCTTTPLPPPTNESVLSERWPQLFGIYLTSVLNTEVSSFMGVEIEGFQTVTQGSEEMEIFGGY